MNYNFTSLFEKKLLDIIFLILNTFDKKFEFTALCLYRLWIVLIYIFILDLCFDNFTFRYQSRFICDTRGAGAGQLTVRIRGPKGKFPDIILVLFFRKWLWIGRCLQIYINVQYLSLLNHFTHTFKLKDGRKKEGK